MSTPPPQPSAKRVKLAATAFAAPPWQRMTCQLDAERAVGITEYLYPELPGWTGVLKKRYTDFLVNEVDLEGNVVHLTELGRDVGGEAQGRKRGKIGDDAEKAEEVQEEMAGEGGGVASTLPPPPPPPPPPQAIREGKEGKEEELGEEDEGPYPGVSPTAQGIIPLSTVEVARFCSKLLRSIDKDKISQASTTHPSLITPPIPRETRSLLHQKIREFSSGAIATSTLTGEQDGCIRIYANQQSKQNERRKRGARSGKRAKRTRDGGGGRGAGDYCHFLLYKENRDTMEVMNLIPRLVNARGKNVFSFAGTKDRRAVTVQRCSALRVSAERLAGLNKEEGGLRGCKLGNFSYKSFGLELGDLGGNEFRITLRECVPLQDGAGLGEIVGRAMERVKKGGFINYFGLQRFGSFGVGTWEVGVEMLKGNWRGAVEKILNYDPALLEEADGDGDDDPISSEDRTRAEACAAFLKDYNLEKAASLIPRRSTAESSILKAFYERGLQADKNGNKLDYRSALQAIPRNLRTMYIHAYQSYVWNYVVSERIRWGADKVMEGDLVIVEDSTTGKKQHLAVTEAGLAAAEAEVEVDQDGEVIINAPAGDQKAGHLDFQDMFQRARPLSKEEAEAGNFAITDIVLPTPGWDVVYPKNTLMDVYKNIMAEHGLDPLEMKRNVKETSLPGSYRKVLGTFIQGEGWWEVKKYRGNQQVVQTDLEKIREAAATETGDKMDIDVKLEKEQEEEEGEEEMAVVLGLRLGTSTYATMALRELMKKGVKVYVPEFGRGEARKNAV